MNDRLHRLCVLTLAAVVFAAGPVHSADPAIPAKEHFKIFLLVGQSNMAGRGKVEAMDETPHPRVLMLNKEDQWRPAVDPLHFDKPAVIGVGPGKAAGVAIAEALPGETIGLVPCAFGGTSIEQWSTGGKLYAEAVRRAKIALKQGTLAGILWHQGEANMKNQSSRDAYPAKAARLFADLRKELDAPDAPVVIGTLGDFLGEPAQEMNIVLQSLPQSIPHSAIAEAKGLAHKGDKVHFDSASARELGKRYAAAWLQLNKKGTP